MLPDDILSWYEASLPLRERKRRGHFSTPPLLVEQILDACGYTPEADLTQVRVLDPACGSGNFLAGAARRLVAFGERIGLSQEAVAMLIQRNLWGFDPDPIACFLAEMQLRATLEEVSGDLFPPDVPLHIYQADGLALPWEPCVDLLVANPPYLATKNSDLSGYRSAQQRGQADSYLLFLNLALQVVRPSGWVGLVLPDPVLARANAAKERTRLLTEFTLHHLWHLSGVFAAEVGAVVLIAQKCPPKSTHQVSWVRERWQATNRPRGRSQINVWDGSLVAKPLTTHPTQTRQALFLRQPGAEFRYLLGDGHGSIIERLCTYLDETPGGDRRFASLSEFLSIHRGEELGRKSPYLIELIGRSQPPQGDRKGTPLLYTPGMSAIHENTREAKPCIVGAGLAPALVPTYYPVLRGGVDVRPYGTPAGSWRIAREAIAKPLDWYLSPKLLVVKSTGYLQAALDMQGHVVLQTLYLLHLRARDASEDDLYFFLALLNSRLLRKYVYVLHTAYKWVQPQIDQHVLARLPIPITEPGERQQIIKRSKLLACSKGDPVVEFNQAYEEQESAICALYDSCI